MRLVRRDYDVHDRLVGARVEVTLPEMVFVALVLNQLCRSDEAETMLGGALLSGEIFDRILDLLDATFDGGLEEAKKAAEKLLEE